MHRSKKSGFRAEVRLADNGEGVINVATMIVRNRRPENGNIADPFVDLLEPLDDGARRGLVHRLAVGYYEGWRPTRAEVALLVDLESGRITEAEYVQTLPSAISAGQGCSADVADDPQADLDRDADRAASAVEADRPAQCPRESLLPTDLQSFSIDCGALAPPFRFVTLGLSFGRSEHQQRLVSLYYELLPPSEPSDPVFFTAPILCLPNVPAAPIIGHTINHVAGTDSVIGRRGPWFIPPAARQLKFLIYAQSPDRLPHRHPAGALHVDTDRGEAAWLPVNGRRAARAARKAQRPT